MYDGATDASVFEVEIIYVRLLEGGYPKDFFIGLQDLEHAHADGVFKAIDTAMMNIDEHWKDKLVGGGSDGANVNIGKNNSVATRLSEAGGQHVLNMHCVAHRLGLSILNAIKSNPMLSTIQDMLKKIYKHYHYSPKALRELKIIAESLDEKSVKPTNLSGTRWVPHISTAIKCLLKSLSVILSHFEHVSSQGKATAEVVGRATYVVKKLKRL